MSEEKVAAANIVKCQDGVEVNFGTRGNTKTAYDLENNTLTFRFLDGKVISWVPSILSSVTDDFVKEVLVFGLMSRIKSVYGPIKELPKIQEAVEGVIKLIESGVFPVRGSAEEEDTLNFTQKAYCLAKAQMDSEKHGHWANYDDPAVVSEVLALWDKLDAKERNKIRKHPVVMYHESQLKMKASREEPEELI